MGRTWSSDFFGIEKIGCSRNFRVGLKNHNYESADDQAAKDFGHDVSKGTGSTYSEGAI